MIRGSTSYEVRASEVLSAVFDLDYRIPEPEDFRKQLADRKIVAMPVESAADGDFVTEDLDAFLNYVRLNGIKTVMYQFCFYTEDDVEDLFKLSPADRSFFGKVPNHDDLSEYQRYCSYLSSAIDLNHPKRVTLYALHNQAVICCCAEDLWMERLPLPNARTIRKACLDSMSYSGSNSNLISFHFDYDTADSSAETAEQETTAETAPDLIETAPETVEEITPVAEETAPETVEEIVPVTEKTAPETVEEIAPVAVETAPETVEEIAPVAVETAPETVEEIVPVTEKTAPETVEEIAPATEETATTDTPNAECSGYTAPDLASADAEIIRSVVPDIQTNTGTSGNAKKHKKQRSGLFKGKKKHK